jgi:nucleoside-diphosphate-sugar epimerase
MYNFQKQDFEYISNADLPLESLKNTTLLVTGATGLIGGMITKALTFTSEKYDLNLKIITHSSKTHGDIREPLYITDQVDYIFHCAAVTSSADMINRPVDVLNVAIDGTRNLLNFALKCGCKSIVYLSSMEVYGQIKGEVTEDMLGFIKLSNPRSSYPESKRMCEMLCNAYYSQFNVPVRIARLSQTFGAGTPKTDTRIFAQFARSTIDKTDIILHTKGESRGNYCYIADTITALLTILLKGENGQAYNVSTESMTIREMAELVANEYGVKTVVSVSPDVAKLGYAPTTDYTLNTDKIRTLGWQPKYRLLDMYKRMITDWSEDITN